MIYYIHLLCVEFTFKCDVGSNDIYLSQSLRCTKKDPQMLHEPKGEEENDTREMTCW